LRRPSEMEKRRGERTHWVSEPWLVRAGRVSHLPCSRRIRNKTTRMQSSAHIASHTPTSPTGAEAFPPRPPTIAASMWPLPNQINAPPPFPTENEGGASWHAVKWKNPPQVPWRLRWVVRAWGLEPQRIAAREPKSRMSTNSIMPACRHGGKPGYLWLF